MKWDVWEEGNSKTVCMVSSGTREAAIEDYIDALNEWGRGHALYGVLCVRPRDSRATRKLPRSERATRRYRVCLIAWEIGPRTFPEETL
jgi:hypothetical protein